MQNTDSHHDDNELRPWMRYMGSFGLFLVAFFIATFCVAMFFSHLRGGHWVVQGAIMIGLYFFVLGACIRLLVKRLSVAAMMLITPIVPLAALILILMLLPLLQRLQ